MQAVFCRALGQWFSTNGQRPKGGQREGVDLVGREEVPKQENRKLGLQ